MSACYVVDITTPKKIIVLGSVPEFYDIVFA